MPSWKIISNDTHTIVQLFTCHNHSLEEATEISTSVQEETSDSEEIDQLYYILVILGIFVVSLIISVVRVVRRKHHDRQVYSYYEDFVNRDEFRQQLAIDKAKKQVDILRQDSDGMLSRSSTKEQISYLANPSTSITLCEESDEYFEEEEEPVTPSQSNYYLLA